MPRSLKSALIVRFNGCLHDSDLLQHLAILAAQGAVNEGELVFQCVEINQAVDDSRTYIYFWSRNPGIPAMSLLNPVSAQWLAAAPGLEGLEVQRLQPVIERVGASAGGQADFVAAYERRAPQFSAAQFALAQQAACDGAVWLFSSAQAVANLNAALPGQDWAAACALATHPRIAQAARAAGFGVVFESRPTLADVVAALQLHVRTLK